MNDNLLKLSNRQVKQILEKGYTFMMIETAAGTKIAKITKEDLVFKKDEVEAFAEKMKDGLVNKQKENKK